MRLFLLPVLLLSLLGAYFLFCCHRVRASTSITFDEKFYLNCGLQTVHDGVVDPRLAAEGVAPLPVLITYVPALWFQSREARPEMWEPGLNDRQRISGPRLLNPILVGLPLIGLVFVWLARRRGILTATAGTAVLVCSPTITAHGALATTDLCSALFSLIAILTTGWYVKQPSGRRLFWLALALAAAMSAKYSAVFLLPVIGLMLFCSRFRTQRDATGGSIMSVFPGALGWSLGRYALLWLMFLPLWRGMHGFGFTGPLKNVPLAETPDDSPWVKLLGRGPVADWIMDRAHEDWYRPAPVAGVLFQYLHNQGGHVSFLMGQRSQNGWWYYFPCAFAFKSTPVELLLTCALAGLLLMTLRHPVRAWTMLDADRQVMLLSLVVVIALAMSAHINIGHRYLILLYPLLIMLAFDRLGASWGEQPWRPIALALLLVAGQAASHLPIGPYDLAYFNRLAGGPEHGWRLLVDSNIDWGQDLPALRQELERLQPARPVLQYFGKAIPAAYGVQAEPLTDLQQQLDDYDLLAVSVSCLQGLYIPGDDPLREFRELPPDGRAGYSIRLYRLDSPARKALFRRAVARLRS